MDGIFVYYVDLPPGVRECVLPCADGYTVYIDQNLDEEGRAEAYRHAVKHIRRADSNSGGDADRIEIETHKI